MIINNIEIVETEDRWEFEEEIKRITRNRSVIDIKFAVTPNVHSTGLGGSYSAGEKYYAMIIFE